MKIKYLSLIILSLGSTAFAGTMGSIHEFNPSLYFKVGSGGSYSMNTNLKANPFSWDSSFEGVNGRVGQTAIYSAAIGYNFSPLMSFDFEYIYRPSYSYAKYQTFPTTTSFPTPNYLSTSRTRYFNLQSNSLMANLYFHGRGISENLIWHTNYGLNIEPFIGGGLGVAFNTVTNTYSTLSTGRTQSFLQDTLRTSIAWQLSAGLNFYNDGRFNLGAGYRYYNGETFNSGSSFIDWQIPTYPLTGIIQTNEFFVTLSYKINA